MIEDKDEFLTKSLFSQYILLRLRSVVLVYLSFYQPKNKIDIKDEISL